MNNNINEEDFVYSDNNGDAELNWEKYIQQEKDSHTHPIYASKPFCLRCQGTCREKQNG